MTTYYLKPEYRECAKDLDTQPIGMALSCIDVTKPLISTDKPREFHYTAVSGVHPFGYADMHFLTLFKNGKRGKPLRQRKVGKRK